MRDHSLNLALDAVAEDVYFTLVRLATHPDTQALAGALPKLLDQTDAAHAAHTALRRDMAKADATAAGVRNDVEAFAGDLRIALLPLVKQDQEAPLFRTYFAVAVSTVQASKEADLRKWLDGALAALAKAAEPELKALAPKAKQLLAAWDAAQAGQGEAATANSQHNASVRLPLRKAVNGARQTLHADLTKLAVKTQRQKRWVESFFRQASAPQKSPPQ